MIWDDILAKLDRIAISCEKLAARWAADDVRYTPPPFYNVPVPPPTLPPAYTPPTGPTPGYSEIDSANFNWDNPGSWRRLFGGGQTKYLAVPIGFNGPIRLEITQTSGNSADLADIVVTNGPNVVKSEHVNTTSAFVNFVAREGVTYGIACDTLGAVLSVNFRRG